MRLLNHFMWGEQIGRNKRTAFFCAILLVLATLGGLCNGTARTVTVFHNNQCKVVSSYFTTPALILQKAGVLLDAGHGYEMRDTQNGLVLRAGPQFELSVTADGQTRVLTARPDRVINLLEELGITVGENDMVTPSADTIVSSACAITVQRVAYQTVTQEEVVEPQVICEETNTLPKGTYAVKIPGVNGTAQVTYEQRVVDGKVVQSTAVNTVVLQNAQPETRLVGTGAPEKFAPVVTTSASVNGDLISKLTPNAPIVVDETGRPLQYKKCINGLATAYTAPKGALTAVGVPAQVGYIAVDPKEIPYGTMMFIRTPDGSYMYGLAKAVDTGGFISGPVDVDLFFNTESECVQFGVRNVEIYVL